MSAPTYKGTVNGQTYDDGQYIWKWSTTPPPGSWKNSGPSTITVSSNTTVGNTVISSNVITSGNTTIASNGTITTGNTTIASNGTITTSGNISTGNTSLSNTGITTGNTTIASNGTITTSNTTIASNGTITTSGNISTGNTTIANTGITTGNTTIASNGTITTSNTTIDSNGTITTSGNISTGNTSLSNTGITTGNTTISSNGTITTSNTTIASNGTITTSGNISTGNTTIANTGITTGNTTIAANGTISTGNTTIAANGAISTNGNIIADTIYANVQGNFTVSASNTTVLFSDSGIIAGSTAFTFDKSSNVLTVANINYPTSDGTIGQVLTTDGNGVLTFTTVSASSAAAGSTGQIQFNDSGSLAANAGLTYDSGNYVLQTGVVRGILFEQITEYGFLTDAVGVGYDYGSIANNNVTLGSFGYLLNTVSEVLDAYTVSTLPNAGVPGQMIYVSNESGGSTLAFSDGTSWRRIQDRAIVS